MKKLLAMVVSAVMVLSLTACSEDKSENQSDVTLTESTRVPVTDDYLESVRFERDGEIGHGETQFWVTIRTDEDLKIKVFTDEEMLGTALYNLGLIDGDKSEYGLYIKYVNGVRADYDLDKAYWALSKDGEALMTGADATEIEAGASYEFTYTEA